MQIIIKGRKNLIVSSEIKSYAEEKVLKYVDQVEEPALCEVMLADTKGRRDGNDKVVHLTLTVPKISRAIHVEAKSTDFFGAIDLAQEKLEQQITKYKDRKKIGSRFPVKYWVEKMLEHGSVGPRWIVKKLRRNR